MATPQRPIQAAPKSKLPRCPLRGPYRPKHPAGSRAHDFRPQADARLPADRTIQLELEVNAECLAGQPYIDMTRFFRRSNGTLHLTSAMWQELFKSRSGRPQGKRPQEGQGHDFAPAAGARFPADGGTAAIVLGKHDGTPP